MGILPTRESNSVYCLFFFSLIHPIPLGIIIPVWVDGRWHCSFIQRLLTTPRPAMLNSSRLATSLFSSWSLKPQTSGSTSLYLCPFLTDDSSCHGRVYNANLSFLLLFSATLLDGLLPHPDTAAFVPLYLPRRRVTLISTVRPTPRRQSPIQATV